jgi:thymidylate synthase
MGRATWESLPDDHRPLSNRYNMVVSSTMKHTDDTDSSCVDIIPTFKDVLVRVQNIKKDKQHPYHDSRVFVIGGGVLYQSFLSHGLVDRIWVTKFDITVGCDVFFPCMYLSEFTPREIRRTKGIQWIEYQYNNKEEQQYLSHIKHIVDFGEYRDNRTGTASYSTFCPPQLRFDLADNKFPLLTTKKCVLRQIFVELQFYLSGRSDSKELEDKKVFVWKGNTTREFLDARGLTHYKEGDMGPSYSFNFRHLGEEYKGCQMSYTGLGFDQLQYCINLIKTDPTSRRIIIDLWDPPKLKEMSLPPCMFLYQFYVSKKNLHCHATLRSSDTFLGLPWNIATASLLTILMARVCDLSPGTLTITTNDAHVYENQLDGITTQLSRTPTVFPKLYIDTEETDITKIEWSDITLLNYNPNPGIKVPMIV